MFADRIVVIERAGQEQMLMIGTVYPLTSNIWLKMIELSFSFLRLFFIPPIPIICFSVSSVNFLNCKDEPGTRNEQ